MERLIRIKVKEQRFVDAYLANNGNATKAALEVGYGPNYGAAAQMGSRLLRKKGIMQRLEREGQMVVKSAGLDKDQILDGLSAQAASDIGDFIDIHDDGSFQFNLRKAKELGVTKLIKRLKHDAETGAPIVQLHDSQEALKVLAKIRGLVPQDERGKRTIINNGSRALVVNLLRDSPEASKLLDALAGKAHVAQAGQASPVAPIEPGDTTSDSVDAVDATIVPGSDSDK